MSEIGLNAVHAPTLTDKLELWFAKTQFTADQRARLYRKLSLYMSQGVPVFDTLQKFESAYRENKKGDPRSLIMAKWMEVMRSGGSFSQAIRGYVPPSEVMLIEAGEQSGDMAGAFEQAIFITENIKKIRAAVINGLSYSVALMLLLSTMVAMFSIKIVPQISEVLEPSLWQGPAATLYSMSEFIRNYGLATILLIVFLVIASLKSMPYWTGNLRKRVADRLPPWSVYKMIEASVFLVSLSSLMKSGVSLRNALLRLMESASPYTSAHITEMLIKLGYGESSGRSLRVGFMPRDVEIDMELLGGSTDFDAAMYAIGRETITDDIRRIQVSMQIVSYAMLFLSAFWMGFVYYGFYTLTAAISANV